MRHCHAPRLLIVCALALPLVLAACGSEEPRPEPAPPRPRAAVTPAADVAHEHEDPLDQGHVLVAGPSGTASHRTAHDLQERARRAGLSVAIAPSSSDLDPLYLVAWAHADAGIVPANVLQSTLHAVARAAVQPIVVAGVQEVHVVVAEASPVRAIGDLEGKVVTCGRRGSASDLAARAVLLASGLDADAGDVTLKNEAPEAAIRALGAGVDAVVIVGHTDDVAGSPRTRLVKLAAEDAAALAASGLGYTVTGDALTVVNHVVATPAAADEVRPLLPTDQPAIAAAAAADGPPIAFRAEGAPLVIASGPAGGTYEKVGAGIARVTEAADVGQPVLCASQGSVESFVLLATGQADLAIVQEDVVQDALRTPAIAPLVARVRLVAPLYAEEVHLVVAPGVTDLAALQGKPVALGEAGSGTFLTARRLLRLAGVQVSGRALGSARALEALGATRVHAAFLVGGQPLAALAGSRTQLAPLAAAEGYLEASVGGVSTVATRALLLCRRDLDPAQVQALVRALFANRKNLAVMHPKWSELDPAGLTEERRGLRVHEGATAAASSLEPDSAAAW